MLIEAVLIKKDVLLTAIVITVDGPIFDAVFKTGDTVGFSKKCGFISIIDFITVFSLRMLLVSSDK